MSDLQIQEETFIPRDYEKPDMDFAEILEKMQTEIKIRIHKYYYDIHLGFGDKCECLEPPHVRMEIKHRIRDMAALYEN